MDERDELAALRRLAELEAKAAGPAKPTKTWDEKVAFERGKLQEEQLKEMPWYERARAGFGKAFTDTAQGISQMMGRTSTAEVDEERWLAQALMDDPAAIGGNLAGNIAQTIAIPGGNTVKGAALVGGAMAGAQPVATGESRGLNTAIGAGGGALGSVAAKGIGKLAQGPKNVLTPVEQELAAAAKAHGIDLAPGQATGNKFLQTVESVMGKLPATAAAEAEKKAAQAQQFTKAVTKQMGSEADNIGEAAMAANKSRLGDSYRQIFEGERIPAADFAPRLQLVKEEAERILPGDVAKGVKSQIDDLFAKVGDDGFVDGLQYQKWRSNLKGSGDSKHYVKLAKEAVDDAAFGALGPEKTAKFAQTNLEYKNMKTIQPLAEKSVTGNVPAGMLLERVRSANPNMAYTGAGDMGELGKIGKAFIKDQVPDSGTAQRAMAQALITGGSSIGAFGASGGDPQMAMQAGMMTLGGTVGLPKLVQALLNKPGMVKYLTEGGIKQADVDPRLIELLLKGSAGAPVAGYIAARQ